MTEFGELKYQLKQTTKNKMQLEEENKGYKVLFESLIFEFHLPMEILSYRSRPS